MGSFSLNLEGPVRGLSLTENSETQINSQQGKRDRALIGYKHSLIEHDRHDKVCVRTYNKDPKQDTHTHTHAGTHKCLLHDTSSVCIWIPK